MICLGAPSTSPPDELVLQITTLPLSLVEPLTFQTEAVQTAPPLVTVTPTGAQHKPQHSLTPRPVMASVENKERIETPSWTLVKPGEDDMEEAKEELQTSSRGPSLSPIKRLRKDEVCCRYYLPGLHIAYAPFTARRRYLRRLLHPPVQTLRGI